MAKLLPISHLTIITVTTSQRLRGWTHRAMRAESTCSEYTGHRGPERGKGRHSLNCTNQECPAPTYSDPFSHPAHPPAKPGPARGPTRLLRGLQALDGCSSPSPQPPKAQRSPISSGHSQQGSLGFLFSRWQASQASYINYGHFPFLDTAW